MKLSVIFDDARITKDGLGYVVMLPDQPQIWAIQWQDGAGHIEYRDAATLNQVIDDPSVIAPYVALWQAAHNAATAPPPPLTLAQAKAQALAALADQRWEATKWFTFDGVRTQADAAISVITGRLVLRRETGLPDGFEMVFKLANGQMRSWDKAGDVAFGAAVAAHVQGCFDVEKALTAAVADAQTAAAVQALVETARVSWPT